MKKVLAILVSLALCLFLLAGCGAPPAENPPAPPEGPTETPPQETLPPQPDRVRVAALKGPTTMGLVKLMQDAEDKKTSLPYDFTIGITDEIVPKISKGELDLAALPANLASVLYNNTNGGVKVLAINTLGVLYVVEKGESIRTIADLKGKTIFSTGKGTTPEYALNYVLSQNGIDPAKDLSIEYKSEAAEIIPLLAQSENGVAILPQPFVIAAVSKVPGLRIALDWTKEWDAVSKGEGSMLTGVVVVNKTFAETYPNALQTFLEEYAASTKYTGTNVKEAAELVAKYGIAEAAIAEKALPYCNIVCISGDEMKENLSGYLSVLFEQNPQSVGGKLPDDGFYLAP